MWDRKVLNHRNLSYHPRHDVPLRGLRGRRGPRGRRPCGHQIYREGHRASYNNKHRHDQLYRLGRPEQYHRNVNHHLRHDGHLHDRREALCVRHHANSWHIPHCLGSIRTKINHLYARLHDRDDPYLRGPHWDPIHDHQWCKQGPQASSYSILHDHVHHGVRLHDHRLSIQGRLGSIHTILYHRAHREALRGRHDSNS